MHSVSCILHGLAFFMKLLLPSDEALCEEHSLYIKLCILGRNFPVAVPSWTKLVKPVSKLVKPVSKLMKPVSKLKRKREKRMRRWQYPNLPETTSIFAGSRAAPKKPFMSLLSRRHLPAIRHFMNWLKNYFTEHENDFFLKRTTSSEFYFIMKPSQLQRKKQDSSRAEICHAWPHVAARKGTSQSRSLPGESLPWHLLSWL